MVVGQLPVTKDKLATAWLDRSDRKQACRIKKFTMIYLRLIKNLEIASRTKLARSLKQRHDTPRTGTHRAVLNKYLEKLGWKWTPTMFVGQGCKVHLKKEELPMGTLIVSCSKHLTVVIDGVLNDVFDCSRNGMRCVYGYWTKGN
jgi:hypothetical protein